MGSSQPDTPYSSTGSPPALPSRSSSKGEGNNAYSSQEPPSVMQPRAGEASQVARTAESIAATHGSMTPAPEPNLRPPTRGEEHKVYAPKTPRPMDISTLVRDKADIDLYREHFSGYRMTRAHLSSSPYIESDPKLHHRQNSHPSHGKVQFSFPSMSFYHFPSHSQTIAGLTNTRRQIIKRGPIPTREDPSRSQTTSRR